MKWTKENIGIFEEEPITFINSLSFNMNNKTIDLSYLNCDKYPPDEKDYSLFPGEHELTEKHSYREYYWGDLKNGNDIISKINIYLEFADKIAVKLIEHNNIKTLYISITNGSTLNDTFASIEDLYIRFFRHLNINDENLEYPILDYYKEKYQREQVEHDEACRQMERDDIIADSMAGIDHGRIENNNTGYNDNLDMDQQSENFWENI